LEKREEKLESDLGGEEEQFTFRAGSRVSFFQSEHVSRLLLSALTAEAQTESIESCSSSNDISTTRVLSLTGHGLRRLAL
jgi:hypothetical protein